MPTLFSLMRIPARLHCGNFSYKPMTVCVFHYPGILDIFLLDWIFWQDWCASGCINCQGFFLPQSWTLGCLVRGMNFLVPQWCSKPSFFHNSCLFSSYGNIFPKTCEAMGLFISNSFLPETFVPLQSIFTAIPTLVIFRWALWESAVALSPTFQADRLTQGRNSSPLTSALWKPSICYKLV